MTGSSVVENLVALWLTALPLMGGPGPVTLSLAAIGAGFGLRPGLLYYIGVCTGTSTVLLIVASGVSGLLFVQPAVAQIITWLAAAYILYLAWRIATAPVVRSATHLQDAPGLRSGYAFALANPKAYAAIGAVYSSHNLFSNQPAFDNAAKISALMLVIFSVNIAWLAGGNLFSRILQNPHAARAINIVFALLLVWSVWYAVGRQSIN